MSDARLRDLERAVARDGTAAARLRLASELERLGRSDEALDALLPIRASAEAREAIGRLRPVSVAHESGYFDVRPIERAPSVLWRKVLPYVRLSDHRFHVQLVASPLGIVLQAWGGALHVLDPASGEELWRGPDTGEEDAALHVAGHRLVRYAPSRGLEAWDLATGARISQSRRDRGTVHGFVAGPPGALVASRSGKVATYEPTPPFRRLSSWTAATREDDAADGASEDVIVLDGRAHRRATGEVLWEDSYAVKVDGAGFAAGSADEVRMRDRRGRVLWETPLRLVHVTALAPAIVVAQAGGIRGCPGNPVHVLDRTTGRVKTTLPEMCVAPLVARDTIYHVTEDVTAYGPDGPLWTVPRLLEDPHPVFAPLDARLVLASRSGEVLCLG